MSIQKVYLEGRDGAPVEAIDCGVVEGAVFERSEGGQRIGIYGYDKVLGFERAPDDCPLTSIDPGSRSVYSFAVCLTCSFATLDYE